VILEAWLWKDGFSYGKWGPLEIIEDGVDGVLVPSLEPSLGPQSSWMWLGHVQIRSNEPHARMSVQRNFLYKRWLPIFGKYRGRLCYKLMSASQNSFEFLGRAHSHLFDTKHPYKRVQVRCNSTHSHLQQYREHYIVCRFHLGDSTRYSLRPTKDALIL